MDVLQYIQADILAANKNGKSCLKFQYNFTLLEWQRFYLRLLLGLYFKYTKLFTYLFVDLLFSSLVNRDPLKKSVGNRNTELKPIHIYVYLKKQ